MIIIIIILLSLTSNYYNSRNCSFVYEGISLFIFSLYTEPSDHFLFSVMDFLQVRLHVPS